MCINNAWGTVCHNNWSHPDASVVCKQLGYATTGCELCTVVISVYQAHVRKEIVECHYKAALWTSTCLAWFTYGKIYQEVGN